MQNIHTFMCCTHLIMPCCIIFKSLKGETICVYQSNPGELNLLDLSTDKIKKTIKDNKDKIFNIKHYFDDNTNTDYLLTSSQDKSIKLYSNNSYESIDNFILKYNKKSSQLVKELIDDNTKPPDKYQEAFYFG